jgi:hypothetical protein
MEEAREILRRSLFELWDDNYPETGPEAATPVDGCRASESYDLLDSVP